MPLDVIKKRTKLVCYYLGSLEFDHVYLEQSELITEQYYETRSQTDLE